MATGVGKLESNQQDIYDHVKPSTGGVGTHELGHFASTDETSRGVLPLFPFHVPIVEVAEAVIFINRDACVLSRALKPLL